MTTTPIASAPLHSPRKRFGQHFLHDPAVIHHLLAFIAPQPGQQLVEIGPGRGALTAGLFAAAGALDVIEIDRDLVQLLTTQYAAHTGLRIHHADALHFDLRTLRPPTIEQPPATPWLRLIGNLPYNISTPLLFHFLQYADCLIDLHIMLQREVVERISAAPGNKTYGRLSVMVQTYCAVERGFTIGAGAFQPPPQVESAVLRLIPYTTLPDPISDRLHHATLVAAAFSQRRKTLRNSLRALITPAQLISADIDPQARAEQLSIADFARLAQLPCNHIVSP